MDRDDGVIAIVDKNKCVGHACCVIAAPELFDLPANSTVAQVLLPRIPNYQLPAAQDAVDECPTGAIHLQQAQ